MESGFLRLGLAVVARGFGLRLRFEALVCGCGSRLGLAVAVRGFSLGTNRGWSDAGYGALNSIMYCTARYFGFEAPVHYSSVGEGNTSNAGR